jgi:ankyrin repeat protein
MVIVHDYNVPYLDGVFSLEMEVRRPCPYLTLTDIKLSLYSSKVSVTGLPMAIKDAAPDLHCGIFNGRTNTVAAVDERECRRTALHFAALKGDHHIVTRLLEIGADVDIQDKHGRTPLHHAASGGYENTVIVLLWNGADVDIQDKHGRTPLHHAASGGYKNTVIVLLQNGADDIQDEHGRTALHHAASGGYENTVIVLLQNGADVDIQDKHGRTALHHPVSGGYENTVIVLLQNGADDWCCQQMTCLP